MEIKKEDLRAQYKLFATEELLRRVRSGTMIPLAMEAAHEELRSRGLDLESSDLQGDLHEEHAAHDDDSGADFVILAHFVNPLRANLLRTRLESEGITAHVLGEHLGFTHILLSTGMGGIHVQVRKDQVDRALPILTEFDEIEKHIWHGIEEETEEASSERPSPYAPPKSRVADVQKEQKRRASLNKPASAVSFWIFALVVFGMLIYLLLTSR